MNKPASNAPKSPRDQEFSPPSKTPFFEAEHADRYARQHLICQIEEEVGHRVICYIAGKSTDIHRDDVLGFADLLCRIPPGSGVDLVLHSLGGDPDAADKLIKMVRDRVGEAVLRVVVPDHAKSAATLMALEADSIVMSNTSELGPIDPQIRFRDRDGSDVYYSAFSYIEAFHHFKGILDKNPSDQSALLMMGQLEPHVLVELERIVSRTRTLAENLLGGSSTILYTAVVDELLTPGLDRTHGQVITAQRAAKLGLNIEYLSPDDPTWKMYWKLYCLQRREVQDDKKLFESACVSLTIDGT